MTNKSRHTQLSSTVTRSVGIEDGSDLVVELRPGGKLRLFLEPVARRLRRNESLPDVEFDLREMWEARADAASRVDWVTGLIKKLPVADFSGPPEKVGYKVQVWLLAELKKMHEQ